MRNEARVPRASFLRMTDIALPPIGVGTWDLRGRDCERAVREALDIGYRHVDTAEMYENEAEVGRALKESGIDRESVFLTTKIWRDHLRERAVPRALDASLARLETDYVDLLLIHWPNESVPLEETLEAMTRLLSAGRARDIGVSNFPTEMWRRALELAPVRINQVEMHPFLYPEALVRFALEEGLSVVAYAPLARGRVEREPAIRRIARRHGKTEAQVALRFVVQHRDFAAIPKAAQRRHLEENLGCLDFELTEEDMASLVGLSRGLRLVAPPWSPVWD